MKIEDILKRVGKVIGSDKNVDIARTFGVAPNTCSNWKKRQAIPWAELFVFAKEKNISFDWLITGKKPLNKECESSQIQEEIDRLQERVDFYKEKADFFEIRLKDYEEKLKGYEQKLKNAERAFFDSKRNDDPEGFDPKKVRKNPW